MEMIDFVKAFGDWVDRWIFRLLLLILVATMLFNTYANWINKEYQEETTQHLDNMELVIQDIPTNQELKVKLEQLIRVANRIQKKLGIDDETE